MRLTTLLRAALLCAAGAGAGAASAGCASAFCTLMTDRYAHGGEPHAGWSTDLRLEVLTQDRLRRGTRSVAAGDVTGEEAIERHTRNTNLTASFSYGFEDGWSLALRIPVVRRDHLHDLVDETTGSASTSERWRFSRLGDVELLGRRQFAHAETALSWSLFAGFKLPTGAIDVTSGDGSRAERALQPGSGTLDAVLGVGARNAIGAADALIAQLGITQALGTRAGFKPGRRLDASFGWSHAYSPTWGSVVQLNLRQRARDRGAQAEPEHSGSTTVDLSPGVTVGIGKASTLYAYVQLPLYQHVNGIQLAPRRAFAAGWTADF